MLTIFVQHINMTSDILLIEDSPTDAAIMMAAFEEIGYDGSIQIAKSGVEALQLLDELENHDITQWPRLILLDLNLPKRSGLDILSDIKTNPSWSWIPTVVISSSSSPSDISNSYKLHANAYISKPRQFEHYENLAKQICSFWFKTAQRALS